MSDNYTDGESVHEDDNKPNNSQEDSGSEYQSEDDHSEDGANSVQSGRSEASNRSTRSGSGRKSSPKRKAPQPRNTKNTKATYSDAYRDLYNEHVEELIRPFNSITHALPASEVSVAVWTPLEKEILFQKVATLGKDNIKEISGAIRTKSETEVRQYLSLLDQGTIEGNVTKALPVFSAADVLAAFEVSKQSEELLEEYANGLAKYQTKSDQKREKKRHGDYWLLTEDVAQELEDQVMSHDTSYKSRLLDEDEDGDDEEDNDDEEEPDDAKSDQEADDGNHEGATIKENGPKTGSEDEPGHLEKVNSQSEEPDMQSSELPEEIMVPAAELLDLPMWLRLARLFMCQPPELGDSWDNLIASRHETPSMYHTAFQDFHNLTVSLTRRVIQATIFQTMTRLRARDKDQPSVAVTTTDVRAAVEILDLQPNTRKFWGSVPRRHGLRIYERGSKFSRGQSRAGAELSLEEAEERLGVGHASTVTTASDDNVVQTVEHEIEEDVLDPDQYYQDTELWTEGSDSEDETPVNIPDEQHSDASGGDDAAYEPTDDEEAQDAARKKQHRKGRLEKNFQKAHDAYLEAVDQEISRVQEIDMWDTLGLPPPKDIKDEEVQIPRQPVIKRRLSDNANWRDDLEYQPPWELGYDTVQPEAFASMHKRGEQSKKRRRLAYDYLEQKGLVTLPQQALEAAIVRKKPKLTGVDTEMNDAPAQEAPTATTETFDDGVPRKKHPNFLLNRVLSRASSVREGSHDSSVSERSAPTNLVLMNRLAKRTAAQQIEDGFRRAEEQRQVEEQVKEEKRKARLTRKAMSEEEKLALEKHQKEERKRKVREQKRREQKRKEKQEAEEMNRLAKEEQSARREKRKADKKEAVQEAPNDEQVESSIQATQSRSKKAKRKSGF